MHIIKNAAGEITAYEFDWLPFNRHSHLRDLETILVILKDLTRQYWGAVVMPNLHPDVINTLKRLMAYKRRIEEAIARLEGDVQRRFQPVMTLYLSEQMDPDEVWRILDEDLCSFIKLYYFGTTTNAKHGVRDIKSKVIRQVLRILERSCQAKKKGALLIHGEVFDLGIDFFDLERVFVKRDLPKILNEYPGLPVVLEHISTEEAAECVVAHHGRVKATITPHHLCFNRNALFRNGVPPHDVGLQPSYFCLPILKTEQDRHALLELIESGNPNVGAGDDTAKHLDGKKFCHGGCGGCYNSHVSAELYFEAHRECRALEHFERFMSANLLKDIYGIEPRRGLFRVSQQEWTAPEVIDGTSPLLHGHTMSVKAEIVGADA